MRTARVFCPLICALPEHKWSVTSASLRASRVRSAPKDTDCISAGVMGADAHCRRPGFDVATPSMSCCTREFQRLIGSAGGLITWCRVER